MVEVVECPPQLSCSPSKPTTQKTKKRKIKADIVAENTILKKKKREEKKLNF